MGDDPAAADPNAAHTGRGSRRLSFGRRRSSTAAPDQPGRRISFGKSRPGGERLAGSAVAGSAVEPDDRSPDSRVTLKKPQPTPKRRDAERRRGGPVPPPPANRREAAKRLRAQQAEDRKQGRSPVAGDQGRLLKRDLGPSRAAVRDVIDGRRNVAVLLLPVALLLVIATFSKNVTVLGIVTPIWLATLLATVVDVVVIVVSIRRRLSTVPDEGGHNGHMLYGLTRSTVFRGLRSPKPRVAPPRLFRGR